MRAYRHKTQILFGLSWCRPGEGNAIFLFLGPFTFKWGLFTFERES